MGGAATDVKPASPGSSGRYVKTIAYYAAFVVLGMSGAALGPALPFLAAHAHTHLSEISYLFTARSLGRLLGSFQGGRLYDRIAGHPMMAAMLLIMAAMAGLIPVVSLLWALIVILLILGMAESALDVGGNTLLVWIHRRRVGPFMNGLHFIWGVGASISPILIAQIVLASGDITWAYWILGLSMVPVAIFLLRLDSPGSPATHATTEERASGPVNYLLVILIAAFFFLYVGMEVSYGGWIYTYATRLNLANTAMAAYLTSVYWGSLTVGRLLAIPIAVFFRPSRMILADLFGCLVSVGVILAWPGSTLALWTGTLGIGLSMASIFPTTLSLAGRRMTITGGITGWFFVGASLGGMFLPWLVGQLFEPVGPQVTMFTIAADILLSLVVFAVLISYSNRLARREARGVDIGAGQ